MPRIRIGLAKLLHLFGGGVDHDGRLTLFNHAQPANRTLINRRLLRLVWLLRTRRRTDCHAHHNSNKTNRGEVESHRMTPLQILDFFRVTIDAACGPGGKSTKLQVRDRGHGKTNPQLGVSQAKSMYKREELEQ